MNEFGAMSVRQIRIAWAFWLGCVSGLPALAQSPSFDCGRARLPDEIAICRTPELAELDNVIAAAYAYLRSSRGLAYADQFGIPFWRLRQACQYDTGCIRQIQIQAIKAYQVAGAPIMMPQRTTPLALGATRSEGDPSAELRLCRNSTAAADKIAHCSNVIAQSDGASALVTAHNTRGLALVDLGRYSEAVDDFTFVIRHEPQIAGFHDNRQNALRLSGQLDDALKDADEAICSAGLQQLPPDALGIWANTARNSGIGSLRPGRDGRRTPERIRTN